jgi:hypothetical protein
MVYGSAVDDNSYQLTAPMSPMRFSGRLLLPEHRRHRRIDPSLGAPAGKERQGRTSVSSPSKSNVHGDANFYYQNDSLTGRNTTEEETTGFLCTATTAEITGRSEGRSRRQVGSSAP